MHVPHVADAVDPPVIVLLNLSPRSARPGRRDQPHRTHAAGRAGPSPVDGGRRQLRRRADDLGGLRQPERGVGGRGRRLGRRLGELPAQRRDHRARADPLVQHGHRLQAAQPAVVVRRHEYLRARRAFAADAAGAAGNGQPRQRRAGRRRGGGLGCRSRRGGGGGVGCRRGRRPVQHRPSGRTPCACCWPRIPRAGRRRCRWSTSTAPGW